MPGVVLPPARWVRVRRDAVTMLPSSAAAASSTRRCRHAIHVACQPPLPSSPPPRQPPSLTLLPPRQRLQRSPAHGLTAAVPAPVTRLPADDTAFPDGMIAQRAPPLKHTLVRRFHDRHRRQLMFDRRALVPAAYRSVSLLDAA